MPTLSAPPTAGHHWHGHNGDVTMAPPSNPGINRDLESSYVDAAGSQQARERHKTLWFPGDRAESHVKVEEVAVSLAPKHEIKQESSEARQDVVALHDAQNFAGPSGTGQLMRTKVENEELASGLEVDANQRRASNRPAGPVLEGATNEMEDRFRLEHAIQTIDAVNIRIRALERNEQRLKKQLKKEKEQLKNSKADAEGAMSLLVLAEEKICEAEALMAVLRQDVDRYRGWWLTEYYSLKAMLAMLPRDSRDDARHIVEAAQSRFVVFSPSTVY